MNENKKVFITAEENTSITYLMLDQMVFTPLRLHISECKIESKINVTYMNRFAQLTAFTIRPLQRTKSK